MLTVEKLKEYGADVEKGLSRCANNESLYLRLVKICIQEISADALGAALKEGDLDHAFEVAHKWKGGVNNLALDPIAAPVCELTELLRSKTPGDYEKLHGDILKETAVIASLMN